MRLIDLFKKDCPYCTYDALKYKLIKDDNNIGVNINFGTENYEDFSIPYLYIRYYGTDYNKESSTNIRINYCPMCGRKLKRKRV